MLDTETVARIEDMFFIEMRDNSVVIECNFCSTDDYLFSLLHEGDSPTHGWFQRALDHVEKHHIALVPGGTEWEQADE